MFVHLFTKYMQIAAIILGNSDAIHVIISPIIFMISEFHMKISSDIFTHICKYSRIFQDILRISSGDSEMSRIP